MGEKYLLCRPLGGLNDNLVQIEKCWRYAEKHDRKLIIDTRRSRGILLPFNRCFKLFNNDCNVLSNPTIDFLGKLEHLSTYPSEVQGRINSYSISYDHEKNYVVDGKTFIRLSFDHSNDYCEDLLVHEQDGGGQSSIDCLSRLRLSDEARTLVERRLSLLPKESFLAIHVRHSDYQTDYKKFFRNIYWQTVNKRLLVCSDNFEVIQFAKKYFKWSDVFSLPGTPSAKGTVSNDHVYELTDEKKLLLFVNAISDIFALAASSKLFIAEVNSYRASSQSQIMKVGIISGYSRLAVNLRNNMAIISQLLDAEGKIDYKEISLDSAFVNSSVYVYSKHPWRNTFKQAIVLVERTTPESLRPLAKALYRFVFR